MGRFPAQCFAAITGLLAFSAGCFRLHRHLTHGGTRNA